MSLSSVTEKAEEKVNVEGCLLDYGFRSYLINPITKLEGKKPKQQINSFLEQLFLDNLLPQPKEKSKLTQAPYESSVTTVDWKLLTEFAIGMLEELPPDEFLRSINGFFHKLEWNQQLACVYFVKELIRLDTHCEWIASDEFRHAFHDFHDKMDANKRSMTTLKSKLKNFHSSKFPSSYLKSAERLAQDLTKAFAQATLDISPIGFRATSLFKNTDESIAFLKLSALSSKLSQLVCLDVLQASTPEKSAAIVEYYINVIGLCLKEKSKDKDDVLVYNLGAAFALYNGLQFGVIKRLKDVWKKVSRDHAEKLNTYNALFSNEGAFNALRKSIREHPDCIPALAVYCGDKEKIQSNTFQDRLMLNAKVNQQFFEHQQYLASLTHLPSQPFRTDLMDKVEHVYYSDDFAYGLSYLILPSRVIKIEDATLENLLSTLKDTYALKAPLVVRNKRKVILKQNEAKIEIEAFVKKYSEEQRTQILELCDKVIVAFERTLEPHSDEDVKELGESIAKMKLEGQQPSVLNASEQHIFAQERMKSLRGSITGTRLSPRPSIAESQPPTFTPRYSSSSAQSQDTTTPRTKEKMGAAKKK